MQCAIYMRCHDVMLGLIITLVCENESSHIMLWNTAFSLFVFFFSFFKELLAV